MSNMIFVKRKTNDSIVEEYLTHLSQERNISQLTINLKSWAIEDFLRFCDLPIAKVKKAHIEAWIKGQEKRGVCRNTIENRLRSLLSPFFNWCLSKRYVSDNPVVAIVYKPDKPRLKDTPLTDVLREQLLPAAKSKRDKLLIYFGPWVGLRRSELSAARWDKMKDDYSAILVRGKGDKERWVPIPDTLVPILKANRNGSPWIFPNRFDKSKPLAPAGVADAFKRLCVRAGVEMTTHTMRHSYATTLDAEGVPIHEIQRLLGHSSIVTTVKYLGHCPERLRQHANKVR